jgi:REP element-mobilizing transposase RayT
VSLGLRCLSFLRGIDRSVIFFDDDDYRRFRTRLAEVGPAASAAVHAYVLMRNHVHL